MSIVAPEVVTPVVYSVPLLCVPSDVSENLSWWFNKLVAPYKLESDKSK